MTKTLPCPIIEVPVLCYPNSGSSLLAGVLHHLGINMGNRLKPGQKINPKGLFEDESFSNTLGKIWFRYNISIGYQRKFNLEHLLEIAAGYQNQLGSLIKKRQQQGIAWGVKEPRLSLLWPVLEQYLENPYWIIASRDFERMTRSRYVKLNKRLSRHRFENILYYIRQGQYFTILSYLTNSLRFLNIQEDELRGVIEHYYGLLESFVNGRPHITVLYENLVENPEREIEAIIRFLPIEPNQKQIDAALSFVSPDLRHY